MKRIYSKPQTDFVEIMPQDDILNGMGASTTIGEGTAVPNPFGRSDNNSYVDYDM